MKQISFYLKKFEKIDLQDSLIKKIIIKEIKDITKVEVKNSELEIRGNQINIKKIGPEKSQIFINKKKIEEKIESKILSEIDIELKTFKKKIR